VGLRQSVPAVRLSGLRPAQAVLVPMALPRSLLVAARAALRVLLWSGLGLLVLRLSLPAGP
jgi:hypothetical protein